MDAKNKEKYDVQAIAKCSEFVYNPFDEDRFVDVVKRAKQRVALGTDKEIVKGGKQMITHQSQLRMAPVHSVKTVT